VTATLLGNEKVQSSSEARTAQGFPRPARVFYFLSNTGWDHRKSRVRCVVGRGTTAHDQRRQRRDKRRNAAASADGHGHAAAMHTCARRKKKAPHSNREQQRQHTDNITPKRNGAPAAHSHPDLHEPSWWATADGRQVISDRTHRRSGSGCRSFPRWMKPDTEPRRTPNDQERQPSSRVKRIGRQCLRRSRRRMPPIADLGRQSRRQYDRHPVPGAP